MEDKYRDGKIYKLFSKSTGLTYYGSTTKKLEYRMSEHYSTYKAFQEGKHDKYYTSFEVLHQDDCIIECVLLYPCNNKRELELKEGYYIRNNECVNRIVPGRSIKEWREDNKERIALQNAKYRKEKFTCACGGKYTKDHKSQHMKTKKHKDYEHRL